MHRPLFAEQPESGLAKQGDLLPERFAFPSSTNSLSACVSLPLQWSRLCGFAQRRF